ncbi:MAG: hypothetical protein ABSA13_10905 [Beijerinckiaceae bacterium]
MKKRSLHRLLLFLVDSAKLKTIRLAAVNFVNKLKLYGVACRKIEPGRFAVEWQVAKVATEDFGVMQLMLPREA